MGKKAVREGNVGGPKKFYIEEKVGMCVQWRSGWRSVSRNMNDVEVHQEGSLPGMIFTNEKR